MDVSIHHKSCGQQVICSNLRQAVFDEGGGDIRHDCFKERFENVGVYSPKYSLRRRQTKIKTV